MEQNTPGRKEYRKVIVAEIQKLNTEMKQRETRMKYLTGRMELFRNMGHAEQFEAYLPRLQGHENVVCELYTRRAKLVRMLHAFDGMKQAG